MLVSALRLLLSLSLLILAGCASSSTHSNPATSAVNIASKALFEDVAAPVGLKFKHDLGNKGRFWIVENTAPGCAFVDYDNDGYLDIFLVQSGSSEPSASVTSRPHCALYHNNRDGTFTDVTGGSGLDKDLGYAQGVAVGDYDNDGYDDIFITSYGGNHLFHNRGGTGHFDDVTKAMGLDKVHGTGYATSAAFGDYDNDGRLDLYICYYMKWNHALNKECRDATTKKLDYCFPGVYDAVTDELWHNTGHKFIDVSQSAGITAKKAHGLAVAFLDYNQDGRQDIFVANDLSPNMLWRNNGNGTFTDVAAETGCAFGEEGKVMAAMGIAIADYDHSGHESMYVSNFSGRPNILFKNLGDGLFDDATEQTQLAASHNNFLSFGCEFFDYDADGWNDLITNNGHVEMNVEHRPEGMSFAQRKQLLHNEKGMAFRDVDDKPLLGDLGAPMVGRGLAIGDFNNDGRIDVLATGQNAPVQLFENRVHNGNHWISFKAVGTISNRDGCHTRFAIRAGNMRQLATVRAGSSYLSSSDRRVYFGLGAAKTIDEVTIRWPSGVQEILKNLPADNFYTVTEKRGITNKQSVAAQSKKN